MIALQTQQAINSAAVTALETHGTEGLAQAMAATTDAIVALQSHGTEGVAQAVFNATIAIVALERDAAELGGVVSAHTITIATKANAEGVRIH